MITYEHYRYAIWVRSIGKHSILGRRGGTEAQQVWKKFNSYVEVIKLGAMAPQPLGSYTCDLDKRDIAILVAMYMYIA